MSLTNVCVNFRAEKGVNMVSADYRVDYRYSNGNIHVDVSGEFNRNTAGAVLEILQTAYTGSGRIFIDTKSVLCLFFQNRKISAILHCRSPPI